MEQTSKTPWGTTEGLYDPSFEHDNCGIGAIVNIKGTKTHQTVEDALKIVENLEHRAGKDAEGKQEMVSVFYFRFLTRFSKVSVKNSDTTLVMRGTMVLECFSCLRMRLTAACQ